MKPVKVSNNVWVNPDKVICFETGLGEPNTTRILCQGGRSTVDVDSFWPVVRVAIALGWDGE